MINVIKEGGCETMIWKTCQECKAHGGVCSSTLYCAAIRTEARHEITRLMKIIMDMEKKSK